LGGNKHLENPLIRVTLTTADASLQVTVKSTGHIWQQERSAGYRAGRVALRDDGLGLAAAVQGNGRNYGVEIALEPDAPEFTLNLSTPGKEYTLLPDYPFPFTLGVDEGYYVQNAAGDGMLFPLRERAHIRKLYGFGGSLPWWAVTDLNRSAMVLLESACLPDVRTSAEDATVYAVPIRLRYAFLEHEGYVGLAKYYRRYFLKRNPALRPLTERARRKAALQSMKDGVYVYLWEEDPNRNIDLVRRMREAGIEHGIAMFYGDRGRSQELSQGIRGLGWVFGLYRMPTGNLFQVARNYRWERKLLLGDLDPAAFLPKTSLRGWERVCGKFVRPRWRGMAKELVETYGCQVLYFDTLVVQMAPCYHPDHPSTFEENLESRKQILDDTRQLGVVLGSGEGNAPAWAVPHLDYFEGAMWVRTYAEAGSKIPGGGYADDFGTNYTETVAAGVDETHRIPLFELVFHDYVLSTWNWRNTNFQNLEVAWKKNLLNVLYGTMPMWNITADHWARHRAELVDSYRAIASVRSKIGFDEMVSHGWLSDDRKVQYTDWRSGYRVTANFGDVDYRTESGQVVKARSFRIDRLN